MTLHGESPDESVTPTEPLAREASESVPESQSSGSGPSDRPPAAGLEQDLAAARSEAAEYRDHLQRTVAEMHNLRKRLAKDAEAGVRFAQRDLVRALIPSIDNLERALGAAQTGTPDPNSPTKQDEDGTDGN